MTDALHAAPESDRPALDVDLATERLAQALQRNAIERDRAGGHAAEERRLIRASGLLSLTIPREFGGQGQGFTTLLKVVRRLAEADSALAHVFAFHHLQIATVLLYADADQRERLLRQTVQEDWFWGNALNPIDTRLTATPAPGGWRLDGTKSFASGSVGSDRLMLSAHWASTAQAPRLLLIGSVSTQASGVQVTEDWGAFGQRQTDSGSVRFDGVLLQHADVISAPGAAHTPRASLRQLLSQSIMAQLYTGIAKAALDVGLQFTREEARPWFAAKVERSADDPYIQHRYAELWLLLRPAQRACDEAAEALRIAMERGEALTAAERGEVAIVTAEAKVLAHRAAMEVSSQFFELTGARSTAARYGFDRFWRNARVHTLHDPVDYKLRDIGRYLLDGRVPDPTAYS